MAVMIYGIAFSRAFRSLWAANELGLDYTHVPTHFMKESKQPDYLAVNPNGRVPAMVDGDLVLFESMAINLYLARAYGAPLRVEDSADEARAVQWSFWGITELESTLLRAMFTSLGLFGEEADPAKAHETLNKGCGRALGVLDRHLEGRDWLVGESFSVADLNVAGVLNLALSGRLDLSQWGNVKEWLDRCYGRPGAKTTLEMARAARG